MRSSFNALVILAISAIAQGCDRAPQALVGKLQASMDPLVGEWREVTSTDTSSVQTIVFKADRTFEFRITIRNPETPDFTRKLLTATNSFQGTFSKGDSVLVVSLDNKAYWKRAREILGDTLVSSDSITASGTTDRVFRYRINGDIFELTDEKTPESWADPQTMRFVRVRK